MDIKVQSVKRILFQTRKVLGTFSREYKDEYQRKEKKTHTQAHYPHICTYTQTLIIIS